jgi:serine/threonine-protein kinase
MGAILFELLAGYPPFVAENDLDLVGLHLHQPPPPLDASVPPALAAIATRALAKHPRDRFADAGAMAAALAQASVDLPSPGGARH